MALNNENRKGQKTYFLPGPFFRSVGGASV